MKKYLFIPAALLALMVAGCAKTEVDTPENVNDVAKKYQIQAEIVNTKTTYDDTGKFSWLSGDKITVVVWNDGTEDATKLNTVDHWTFNNVTGAAASATFESTEITSPWNELGVALYPNKNAYSTAYLGEAGTKDDLQVTLQQEINPDLNHPLSVVPLIGRKNSSGVYQFSTATGILKVTIEDIPTNAYYLVIEDPSGTYNFSGTFAVGDENEIKSTDGVSGSTYHKKTIRYTPSSVETRDFYIPVPTGTIPVGTTLKLMCWNGAWEYPIDKTFKSAVTITANHVTPLKALSAGSWSSLGNGKFIDTFVWSNKGFGTAPVEVEFFKSTTEANTYRIANPYKAAALANGLTPTSADDYLTFSVDSKGRIKYGWTNMGFVLTGLPDDTSGPRNTTDNWAMIDGYSVAGYGSGYAKSHVVSYNSDGSLANVQMAPCYRTEGENQSGNPTSYQNEYGRDGYNGVIEVAFPGSDILMPYTITSSMISVSANQSNDGGGAAALIDGNLERTDAMTERDLHFWHSPWSGSATGDPVYGIYAQVNLKDNPGVNKFAFSYCTRNTTDLRGMPKKVVVGASKNGRDFTKLGEYELDVMYNVVGQTWVGLPVVDASNYAYLRFGIVTNHAGYDLCNITDVGNQFCNLGELMVFGVSSGNTAEWEPALETGQLWIKESMITVNSDACTYAFTGYYGGNGYPALVDFDKTTFWHSSYVSGYSAYFDNTKDYDPYYGICIDINLPEPVQNFHLSYYTRSDNNNGVPRAIIYAGSNDGLSWTEITSIEDDTKMNVSAGTRVDLPNVVGTTPYNYLRIGITKAGSGTTANSLLGANSTAIGELLLFKDSVTSPVSPLPGYNNGGVISW